MAGPAPSPPPRAATAGPQAAARPVGRAGRGGPGPGLLRRRLRHRHHPADHQPGGAAGPARGRLHQGRPPAPAGPRRLRPELPDPRPALARPPPHLRRHRPRGLRRPPAESAVPRPDRGHAVPGPAAQRLPRTPLAVAIYAVAFIAAMALQLVVWLDVTRPERRDLLTEPVPDEVRAGFSRTLSGMLVVFGAVMPLGMFAPRYAAVIWAVMIPLRLVVVRFTDRA